MGLTAHDMSDMTRLAQLAVNPIGGTSREEIYLAVASLYRIQGTGLNARERALMRDILQRLTGGVEMAIRIALAQRLADDTTAPHDLILMLVDDTIEVARPLILNSPLLTDADMLRLIAEAGIGHQEAVAGRPNISEPVTGALVRSNTESVLLALVHNATANISHASYETLVGKSRALVRLQEPLTRRPDLPPQLAGSMCQWVSDTLKSHIQTHYLVPIQKLDSAMAGALQDINGGAQPPGADSARKLIDKLDSGGQLKPGFLMRVLSQSQIDLFDMAFARMLEIPPPLFRKLLYEQGVRPVALACRAAGIDRSVFPTVFSLSRQARGRHIMLSRLDMAEADRVFTAFTRQSAQDELRQLIPN